MTQEEGLSLSLNQDSGDPDNKDNDSDGFRNKKENMGPPTKVVIRRLPPTMTPESFLEQISPVPDNDYLYFVRADMSLGQHAFARAYINFLNEEEVFIFKEKFDGYVFVDQKGNEYPAVVEFSPFQKIPKKKSKKKDAKCGTIEQDVDYIKFVESLQNPKDVHLPTAENYLEEIESRQRELKANNGVLRVTTPLIEHIKQKKAEKLRIREEKREERKRREIEKKRMREEERKRRKAEKDKFGKDGDRVDDKGRLEPTVKLLKNPEREKEKTKDGDKDRLNRFQDATRPERSKPAMKDKDWERYRRPDDEDRQRQKDRQRRFRDRVKRDKDDHGFQTRVLARDEAKTEGTECEKARTGGKHEAKGRSDWQRTDYKARDGWAQRDRTQGPARDREDRRAKGFEKAPKKEDKLGRTGEAAKAKPSTETEVPSTLASETEHAASDWGNAVKDCGNMEESYQHDDGKPGEKVVSRGQRLDRRIRNKDRPSIALYRPGMWRLCTQKDGSSKEGLVSPTSSSSPSPVPQLCGAKTSEGGGGASFDEPDNVNSGKSSESGNSLPEDKLTIEPF